MCVCRKEARDDESWKKEYELPFISLCVCEWVELTACCILPSNSYIDLYIFMNHVNLLITKSNRMITFVMDGRIVVIDYRTVIIDSCIVIMGDCIVIMSDHAITM
jgi:hypothetical protein